MGLDCQAVGLPKPGHEVFWNSVMEKVYAGEEIAEDDIQTFLQNSYMACEMLDAPVVGKDEAANRWVLALEGRGPFESDKAVIKRMMGYRALDLIAAHCDGIPKYNASALGYVDETSLRGQYFSECEDVLPRDLIERAWTHMRPEEAVMYGDTLLAHSARLKDEHGNPTLAPDGNTFEIAEKIDFLNEAGRWYRFWGLRGHPIEPDY